jgi:predicted esterase
MAGGKMATESGAASEDHAAGSAGRLLVVFVHGKETKPWGRKITALAEVAGARGCAVASPDFSDLPTAQARVDRLCGMALPSHDELLLVGSSMGAYVVIVGSLVLDPRGLFVMAPPIGLPTYPVPRPRTQTKEICVVHGWRDRIVPLPAVIGFAECHRAELHVLDAEHDLHERIGQVAGLFDSFLATLLGQDGRARSP